MKFEVYEKSMEIVNQGNGMEALIVDESKGLLVLKNERKEEENACLEPNYNLEEGYVEFKHTPTLLTK